MKVFIATVASEVLRIPVSCNYAWIPMAWELSGCVMLLCAVAHPQKVLLGRQQRLCDLTKSTHYGDYPATPGQHLLPCVEAYACMPVRVKLSII